MVVNGARVQERLQKLGEFGRDSNGGWSRFSFTESYMQARNLMEQWMKEAGMELRIDNAGNLIARKEGSDASLPAVASGSHIDTVRTGGLLDGNLGAVAAVEVAQVLYENQIKHRHPFEVIVFSDEEGARFGAGTIGSRAMAGKIDRDTLYRLKDEDGISLAEALKSVGVNPDRVEDAYVPKGYYKAFFEMHIEQGRVLEELGIDVGIVEGIAAPIWLAAEIVGRADHAGATPMNARQDALVAAAEIVLEMERLASKSSPATVGTVGKLVVKPGTPNVVPGGVDMVFDIRDISAENRTNVLNQLKEIIKEICNCRRLQFNLELLQELTPILLSTTVTEIIEESTNELGFPYHRMNSGAAHDAQAMAEITDTGMIFTPSKDGKSHCPEEYTEPAQIEKCLQVLYQSIKKLII